MRFKPEYRLSLETVGGGHVDIELPYTVEFEIRRNGLASSQTGAFTVYGLSEKKRNLIQKDQYAWTDFRAIQFRAGYDGNLAMAFNGFIRYAYSQRPERGPVFTRIEAYDGGLAMANGFSAFTMSPGQTREDVLKKLAQPSNLPGTDGKPVVGSFPTANLRGAVLCGNTWELIQQLSGSLAVIDGGKVKILNHDEAIEGDVPVLDSSTGLLGSPRRADTMIEADMIFEPRLQLLQTIKLKSTVNEILNGTYKVMAFRHSGTISAAIDRERKTTVSLWLGEKVLKVIGSGS